MRFLLHENMARNGLQYLAGEVVDGVSPTVADAMTRCGMGEPVKDNGPRLAEMRERLEETRRKLGR